VVDLCTHQVVRESAGVRTRCRANLEQTRQSRPDSGLRADVAHTRQSRPDSGLGLRHFQDERRRNHSSCIIQTDPLWWWPPATAYGVADLYGAEGTDICSGSEAGSYLRLIDFVYHSTLGLRVLKKKGYGLLRGTGTGRSPRSLSSEHGTYQTVKTRFWPWLSGKSPSNVLSSWLYARQRTCLESI